MYILAHVTKAEVINYIRNHNLTSGPLPKNINTVVDSLKSKQELDSQ